ncbi:MAG: hypothetical protein K9L17_06155 [Clostridiales bacterium]|nr:hypothetical protein [Clostridiales bacterium]MCF8022253.1 hypothetical protein [Clostridiales bacterium]
MERFRKFIGKNINMENIKNLNLHNEKIACTYLPDPPDDFDELEFRTGFKTENDIMIIATIEQQNIQKIFIGKPDENDPDIPLALTEAQKDELLSDKGTELEEFFNFITQ